MKSWNLNLLEPYGPLQACNGTALPFFNFKPILFILLWFICKYKFCLCISITLWIRMEVEVILQYFDSCQVFHSSWAFGFWRWRHDVSKTQRILEMSIPTYQTTQHHILADQNPELHSCGNLRPLVFQKFKPSAATGCGWAPYATLAVHNAARWLQKKN
jgi:hypothetical protein